MLVSVVMPVFNASEHLREAVQSLINQTYTNWELIAVDDGSTDDSWKILQSFTDSRIKTFQRANGGQSAATNTGLEHIQGAYVLFFDADDLMDCQKIEVQVRALQSFGDNNIAIGKWAFFIKNIEDAVFDEEPIYFTGKPIEWLNKLWSQETMMPNHGYLIPRSIMERAGKFYDESIKLNIDFEYFTRMVMNAENVVYCPESICYYRKSIKSSKTYKPSYDKQLSALNARIKALSYFLERHNNEKAKDAARMALTILTFSFPAIRKQSKQALIDLGLDNFGTFGGPRFKLLSSILGFENTIRVKALYQKLT